MRPKKIYINADEILSGQDWGVFADHATEQHTAEYTDLSQVWHDRDEEPRENERLFLHVFNSFIDAHYDKEQGCFISGASTPFENDRYVKRWAYIKDLLPNEKDNGE